MICVEQTPACVRLRLEIYTRCLLGLRSAAKPRRSDVDAMCFTAVHQWPRRNRRIDNGDTQLEKIILDKSLMRHRSTSDESPADSRDIRCPLTKSSQSNLRVVIDSLGTRSKVDSELQNVTRKIVNRKQWAHHPSSIGLSGGMMSKLDGVFVGIVKKSPVEIATTFVTKLSRNVTLDSGCVQTR